jgi:hypothetical protein
MQTPENDSTNIQVKNQLAKNDRETESLRGVPDVTLRFVYPDDPSLVLDNISNATAKQVKWVVTLWNMDNPKAYSYQTESEVLKLHEPLQIPISIFDFIRPKLSSGPLNLFGSNIVAPHVKNGDRLVGSASVVCSDCARGHTFLVYIEFGKGGWYYELQGETSGNVVVPPKLTRENVKEYAAMIVRNSPAEKRIPIKPLF